MIYSDLNMKGDLEYQVAIYGAGPAGITLARALAAKGILVGLFEAGGESHQVLGDSHPYHGENVGRPYDMMHTRLRYLGGASNHWGGWCRPLDSYDFEDRHFLELPGWPITKDDLNPYYQGAIDVCEIPTAGLGLEAFDYDFGFSGFDHELSENLVFKNFLFSPPTRFGSRYRDDLQNSEFIDCFLDATLVKLHPSDGDGRAAISAAEVRKLSGQTFTVKAEQHVVAMGALENARTLMHSEVADSSGYLGRCFSDHLGKTVGGVISVDVNRYFMHQMDDKYQSIMVSPHLAFSEAFLRKHGLLNAGFILNPYAPRNDLGKEILRQQGVWLGGGVQEFRVLVRMENTPSPSSRLALLNATDEYGVPRLQLDWQPAEVDYKSLVRTASMFEQEMNKGGRRFKWLYQDTQVERDSMTPQAHHMGTTRMSADPKYGVVDKSLKCHDLDNLYIAGSSVFPQFGFANPTMTIVALSLRLADTLQKRVRGGHV